MTELHLGDCLDVLPTLAPGSIDAVITRTPLTESGHRVLTNGTCRRPRRRSGPRCDPRSVPAPAWRGGTTCLAALAEGRGYVGIERDPRYHAAAEAALAEARMA